MKNTFSKWPGAWERHLIRRHSHPHYFGSGTKTTEQDLIEAKARDQQELAQFHSSLQTIVDRTTELNEESSANTIMALKKDLEICHDTAFGLAADLSDQKAAIAALNDVITTAMRRTLRDKDEPNHLRLIQNESKRISQLSRLQYPIVCDLLRSISPIPKGELTAALLSESEAAYITALEVMSRNDKEYLAKRIDTIIDSLNFEKYISKAIRKRDLLRKNLPDLPINNEEPAMS